jgi:hypothetical protein
VLLEFNCKDGQVFNPGFVSQLSSKLKDLWQNSSEIEGGFHIWLSKPKNFGDLAVTESLQEFVAV